jgi:hypothetical protein
VSLKDTSREGHRKARKSAPTVRDRLLAAFIVAGSNGLTDEEAAEAAGVLDTCYWKRANELRENLDIRPTERTRVGRKGVKRTVSVVTHAGIVRSQLGHEAAT